MEICTPSVLLTLCVLQDYDPMAERRPQRISEKQGEYKERMRNRIISPERYDPFAEGL